MGGRGEKGREEEGKGGERGQERTEDRRGEDVLMIETKHRLMLWGFYTVTTGQY